MEEAGGGGGGGGGSTRTATMVKREECERSLEEDKITKAAFETYTLYRGQHTGGRHDKRVKKQLLGRSSGRRVCGVFKGAVRVVCDDRRADARERFYKATDHAQVVLKAALKFKRNLRLARAKVVKAAVHLSAVPAGAATVVVGMGGGESEGKESKEGRDAKEGGGGDDDDGDGDGGGDGDREVLETKYEETKRSTTRGLRTKTLSDWSTKREQPGLLNMGAKGGSVRAAEAASINDTAGVSGARFGVIPDKAHGSLFNHSNLEKISAPKPVLVRFYALKGFEFVALDGGSGESAKSDPFLKIRLGDHVINDEKNYVEDTTSPDFFKCYEFKTTLPGPSQLVVQAWDYDLLSPNDLIGETTIDLEDRWFNDTWKELGTECQVTPRHVDLDPSTGKRKTPASLYSLSRFAAAAKSVRGNGGKGGKGGSAVGGGESKNGGGGQFADVAEGALRWRAGDSTGRVPRYRAIPTEKRNLYSPLSRVPQGRLECWVEVLTEKEKDVFPKADVALPRGQEYELRVIIWDVGKNIIRDDAEGMVSDLFVTAWMEGQGDKKQRTDTHWRCEKGHVGSFNWRMKFPITLPMKDHHR